MLVSQADFRTVKIEKGPLAFLLRYSLYQNGEERLPESITCRGDTVVAYFLTFTIRDYIAERPDGFAVERNWKIIPEGAFALSFCLDFPSAAEVPYLFPGLHAGMAVSKQPILAPGARTACANGLYLFSDPESFLIFSDPPRTEEEAGSVALKHMDIEEESYLRIEVLIPGAAPLDNNPAKRSRRAEFSQACFQSEGNFDYSLRLNAVTGNPTEIYKRVVPEVLKRFEKKLHRPRSMPGKNFKDYIEQQIQDCLQMFLIAENSTCGLQKNKRSKRVCALAGCSLAYLIRRYLPEDKDLCETALRLADFALKGQHPKGLFYPTYYLDRRSWLDGDPRPENPPALPLARSAEIASRLIELSEQRRGEAEPAARYIHAVTRMADALLAEGQAIEDLGDLVVPDSFSSSGQGITSAALIELFLKLHRLTGKDVYKKAVVALKNRYFKEAPSTLPLLGWQEGVTEVEPALSLAHAAIHLAEAGYVVKGMDRYFAALLPWVHLNHPGSDRKINPVGGTHLSLKENKLFFRGFELSYVLLMLNGNLKQGEPMQNLDLLISQLFGFCMQAPPGTSCYTPDRAAASDLGAVQSHTWVRELYYLSKLHEAFPGYLKFSS